MINLNYLTDGSYSVSDIQYSFDYIMKNYETVTVNPPIRTYINKIKNIILFEIETGYYLELLTYETKK